LKNQGFTEESLAKVGLYAISTSTTLESNKSLDAIARCNLHLCVVADAALPGFAGSTHRKQESPSRRSLWCRSSPFPSATHIATCVLV